MISADQLILFRPERADYAHQITTAPPPGFSDFPAALYDAYVFPNDKFISLIIASTSNLDNELPKSSLCSTSSDLSLMVTQQFD